VGCQPDLCFQRRAKRVLDIKIQADSVDTGSGLKNGKLKGKDFFDVKGYWSSPARCGSAIAGGSKTPLCNTHSPVLRKATILDVPDEAKHIVYGGECLQSWLPPILHPRNLLIGSRARACFNRSETSTVYIRNCLRLVLITGTQHASGISTQLLESAYRNSVSGLRVSVSLEL
jgi:hypothetical protein